MRSRYLRSVRGGPALGLLVLGLARYGDSPGRERDFLDRLLIRDRAELRAVETPAGAVKLVARLLMETGRPAEADDLLRPMADRRPVWIARRPGCSAGRPSSSADKRRPTPCSSGPPASAPTTPRPSRRRSSARGSAPSAIRRSTARISGRAPTPGRSTSGSALKDVPLPDRPVPDPMDPRIHHSFTRKSADRIEMEPATTRTARSPARSSRMHSARASTASRWSRGTSRRARSASCGSRTTRPSGPWRATKGVNAVPHERPNSSGWSCRRRRCASACTATRRGSAPHCRSRRSRSAPRRPIAASAASGATGPGSTTSRPSSPDIAESAIGATPGSPPRRLLRSCNECHASNGSVEPSDPEFTRVQGTTLMFSRCFTATEGRDPLRHLPRPASRPRPHDRSLRGQVPRLPRRAGIAGRRHPGALALPGQSGLGLHRLPHAQGARPDVPGAIHRPPHPRPSHGRGDGGQVGRALQPDSVRTDPASGRKARPT